MSVGPRLRVVLCCTACQRSWEPDLAAPVEAAETCCPDCGGWTWIGELTDPTAQSDPTVGGGWR